MFLDARDFFDFQKFRLQKESTKNTTLVYKLTETSLFANFIEARSFGKSDQDEQIIFFDEVSKLKRTKKQPQLVGPFQEQKTVKTMAPLEYEAGARLFKYMTFPRLDAALFYAPRRIECYHGEEAAGLHLKSLISNEQLARMNEAEWARYLAEIVYILWFQLFTTTLPMYGAHSRELVRFCQRLLAHVTRKLYPMRDIEVVYRRLFEACGTCRLPEEIRDIFQDMKRNKIDPDKVTFGTYYQAYQVAKKANPFAPQESYLKHTAEDFQRKLQDIAVQQQHEEQKANLLKAPLLRALDQASEASECGGDFVETQAESGRASKLSSILENKYALFLEFERLCQQCDKPLKEEEVLSCFSKNLSAYTIRCPLCKDSFVPKFKVFSEAKTDQLKGKEGMSVQLLSPVTLYKEYINIVEQKGEQIALKEGFMREHRTVFWNIVLYFKILRLPLFMLDLDYSHQHIEFQITSINKYLPSEKKLVSLGGGIPKTRVEQSPARKSSVGRLTSSVIDSFLGKSNQKPARKDSVVTDKQEEDRKSQHGSNSFFKRPPSS